MQDYHQLQPISMPSPAPVTWQQQFPSHDCPSSSSNNSSSMKRGRVCSEESSGSLTSLTCETATQPVTQTINSGGSSHVPIATKKARSNNYRVPHSVKPSLLTAMGTLAYGSSNKKVFKDFVAASVPTRRRLSGGHLDQYVGGHEKTFDSDPNLPRSMSF